MSNESDSKKDRLFRRSDGISAQIDGEDWVECGGGDAGAIRVRLFRRHEAVEARDCSGQRSEGRSRAACGEKVEEPSSIDRREYTGRETDLPAAMRAVPRGRRTLGDEARPGDVPPSYGFELTPRSAME